MARVPPAACVSPRTQTPTAASGARCGVGCGLCVVYVRGRVGLGMVGRSARPACNPWLRSSLFRSISVSLCHYHYSASESQAVAVRRGREGGRREEAWEGVCTCLGARPGPPYCPSCPPVPYCRQSVRFNMLKTVNRGRLRWKGADRDSPIRRGVQPTPAPRCLGTTLSL